MEKIGVGRAIEKAGEADLILCVFDAARPLDENDREILKVIEGKTGDSFAEQDGSRCDIAGNEAAGADRRTLSRRIGICKKSRQGFPN